MYKCVLTVPLTTMDPDLPINMKKINGVIRGTMCTKCVLTVPLTKIDEDLSFNMKNLFLLSEERCPQNVN